MEEFKNKEEILLLTFTIRLLFNLEENVISTLVSGISWFLSCFPVHATSKYIIMSVCLISVFIITVSARNRLLYLRLSSSFKQ